MHKNVATAEFKSEGRLRWKFESDFDKKKKLTKK